MDLQATRLGKVINECRRRTNNEVLAKRAKHLVRHWRNMMIAPSSAERSNSTVVSPSSMSPGGDPKVESVPKTHVANKRLRKNASPVAGEPPVKASKMNGAMFAAAAAEMSEDSVDCDFSRLREPAPVTEEDSSSSGVATAAIVGVASIVTESVPEQDPPLPKKRSRKKAKKKTEAEDIIKEKLVALSKTVRVKTTEELVAGLKSRTEDRLLPSTSNAHEFNSVKPSLSNNVHAAGYIANATKNGRCETHGTAIDKKLNPETRVEQEIAAILSKLPPVNPNEIIWDSSPESSVPPSPKPVTEEDVDRYLHHQWDGVNGCVTHEVSKEDENTFREWHEMVARRTTNDALIHILPYSIVD